MNMKTREKSNRLCKKCGTEITEEYYHKGSSGAMVKSHFCKPCRIERDAEIKQRNILYQASRRPIEKEYEDVIVLEGFIFKKISRYYYINCEGRVYNGKREKFLKTLKNPSGYCKVILENYNQQYIHTLVWKAFGDVELEDGLEINHKDHDKSNNHINNLEPVTHQMNVDKYIAHRKESGTVRKQDGRKLVLINIKTNERNMFDKLFDVDNFLGKCKGYTSVLLNSYSSRNNKTHLFIDKNEYDLLGMENKGIKEIISILINKNIPDFL